ncbi:molybdate ABC transporter substrate-binding protein [Serratia microhaemolytica]|uniref:molybdate ABC transporter substrate-binding protein n=1 Tax=Serratia microhaemolytica TaxID=2675110 RepID=UPI003B82E023
MFGVLLISLLLAPAAASEKITLFAASSLTNALQQIAEQYQQAHDVRIVSSFASSSTLARQIEQGAPADIFISADQLWMDYLWQKKQLLPETRYTLLGNALVLISSQSVQFAPIEINNHTDWIKLLAGGRLALGDPAHVPIGLYAKQALENLGSWATVAPHLARANNVRSALALVERQEAPLGIVYRSDAVASNKVQVVATFPASSHAAVEYPMAIIQGQQRQAVDAFYHYLKGPQAAAIFQHFGFSRSDDVN